MLHIHFFQIFKTKTFRTSDADSLGWLQDTRKAKLCSGDPKCRYTILVYNNPNVIQRQQQSEL